MPDLEFVVREIDARAAMAAGGVHEELPEGARVARIGFSGEVADGLAEADSPRPSSWSSRPGVG